MPNLQVFELTNTDYNVEYIFHYFTQPYLSYDNFYRLYYWFLCQVGTTLLISKDVEKLVEVSEVLRTMICPFVYDDPYIPVLAPNMIKSIEAPFPCHIGLMVSLQLFAFKIGLLKNYAISF